MLQNSIGSCESIHERLEEGIKTLENPKDDKAFEAFRMANLVMANQGYEVSSH